ncbi:LacI family DNA-binding transcriptional regulator [Paenibacillus polymyxa]|uniref:LacI family DNA-binding transcriptional regulator n=1 Tax=Paenibacillus polymyxa TaxID=1406 RepID=UPI002AB561DF|nr:LacI family DNA-binding transcriptional regulator [Paenibacillus polymyxa]MDY8024961.1 LacI family DNA-binding transcriptional regulator [Paenibacillus polymyxa]
MATIKDIAKLAEVSTTTVSRVLNNDPAFSVSEQTRNKVLAAAKQLEYKTVVERYNKKYYRFALVYKPDIFHNHLDNDFHFSIRNGIDKICAQHEIDLINIFNTSSSSFENLHGAIIQGNYTNQEIEDMVSMLRTEHIIIIGRCPDDNKYDSVWFDTKRAIHSALKYLTSLGHRDIGYIGGIENVDLEMENRRDQIFIQYMSRYPEFNSSQVYIGEPLKSDHDLIERAFQDKSLPSAFFIANDPIAIKVLDYLKERHIQIPETFSMVSLDGHQMTNYTSPPLTTVQVPTEYMGKVAIQTLIEKVEGERELTQKVLVPTELEIRKSCKIISL